MDEENAGGSAAPKDQIYAGHTVVEMGTSLAMNNVYLSSVSEFGFKTQFEH